MTRHSKNCTANTVYTYHERKRDAKTSGYGTQVVRLGKDSVKDFDCCSLTLQPAKDPVITTDGYLYDRAAILEYILTQKADIKRKIKIYEKQRGRAVKEVIERRKAAKEEEARHFMALNTLDTHAKALAQAAESEALANVNTRGFISTGSAYKPGSPASFWSVGANQEITPKDDLDIEKPDMHVRCPMSGKPLRYKDLVSIKFSDANDDTVVSTSACTSYSKPIKYCCAVSKDPLTNSTSCVLLKTSGAVVTKEVVDTILKKEMIDPLNGKVLSHSDFIPLKMGSLGFSDERSVLTAKRSGPVMPS